MAKKKEEKTYCIKNLSEKQILVMKNALEMYTRLGLLQFSHLIDHMFNWGNNKDFSDAYLENREQIEMYCNQIRTLLSSKDEALNKYNPNGNWSLGIGGDKTSVDSQIAYEMEKDIELITSKNARGKLTLTDETSIIVKEENQREEKLKQIIQKLKDK